MPVWGMLTTTGTSAVLASRMWNEAISILSSDLVETPHGVVEGSGAILLPVAHTGMHPSLAPHIHVADVCAAAADDQGVHQCIHVVPAQGRGLVLHHHQIREASG